MKKLIGLILFLNSLVAFSQPVRSRKLNLDHFTFREKKQAEEFSKLNRSSLNHPELGMMPFDGPACTDYIELIDRRDETSRYFVKEKSKGSKFIQQQASGAINFQDVNGFWREINYRLEKKNDKLFVAGNQPQPVSIDLNRNIITLQNSGFILKAEIPELIWRDEKGNDHSVGNADLSNYTSGDDGIKIINFYPGIDFVFSVRQGQFETSFILNQMLPYKNGDIILRQKIDLPEKFSFVNSGNKLNEHQEFIIADNNNVPFFTIEKGYALDNNIYSTPYRIKSSVKENKYLEFSVAINWLNDPDVEYPVIIDPVVTTQNALPLIGITGTKFSPVCWTNSCDYFMNVNTPSNSTITAVSHTFEFYASGLCFADDGGYSIDYGACHAPASVPDVYYNPLHISPAIFTADPPVYLNEFNACFPPPQCAPQSMNFTLHFFRCNNDPDINCAANCIRATRPWTMFVEGTTLELSYFTAAQQMCLNSTAELVATAVFGVEPYSYSWSPGVSLNDTLIVSPASSTIYTVTVTDACGITVTDTTTVNVATDNNPGFNVTPNPACENSQVTVNGNGSGAPNDYDWIVSGSNAAGGIINDDQNPVISYSIPGNYEIILSYPNGICNFTDTVPVTVTALGTTSVSLSAMPSVSICLGDTITFKATPVNGGIAPVYEFLIDGVSVQNGPVDSLVTDALINGSVVEVILNSNAFCSAPVIDTATLFISVSNALGPQVTISPDTILCPGSPLTLNTSSVNGGATPSYQWFANGNSIPGATSASYSFVVTPPDTIIGVVITSSLNCVSNATAGDTSMVNTYQNIQTSVTLTANPVGIVCQGDSIHYAAHTNYGGDAPQFQWTLNGSLVSVTDSFFSLLPSDLDSISVQLTSSLSCVTNPADDAYMIANVSPAVSPGVTVAASPSTFICQGDTIIFTARAVNAGSNPVFIWTVNGNPAGTNDSIFTTSTLNNSDVVRIIINSSLSCAPVSSDTDFVSINVSGNELPVVTINAASVSNCEGVPIQFAAVPANGGATPAFQWFVNGVSIGQSNDTILLSTLQNGDTLQAFITSSLNCVSPPTAFSLPYIINLQPRVMPRIDIVSNPSDTICLGQNVVLQANIQNGGSAPLIQWYVNSILSNVTSSVFSPGNFIEGDVIVANLTSNANCLVKAGDTSNYIRINYHSPLNLTLTSTTPDCPGFPATITAHPGGGNGGPYQIVWSNGSVDTDSIVVIPDNNTIISVQLEDNCTVQPVSINYTVPVLIGPVADFGYVNHSPGSFLNNIQFVNFSTSADSWIWYFPESNTLSTDLNPLHQFPEEGTYDVLLVTWNNNGCIDSIAYNVSVREEIAVFYPTSFSPNGDGLNDFFQPLGASLEDYELTIYNRWGEMIYNGNSKSAWDGRIKNSSTYAPEGSYVFRIDLIDEKFETKVVTGKITLIR